MKRFLLLIITIFTILIIVNEYVSCSVPKGLYGEWKLSESFVDGNWKKAYNADDNSILIISKDSVKLQVGNDLTFPLKIKEENNKIIFEYELFIIGTLVVLELNNDILIVSDEYNYLGDGTVNKKFVKIK